MGRLLGVWGVVCAEFRPGWRLIAQSLYVTANDCFSIPRGVEVANYLLVESAVGAVANPAERVH
jgi:hypothetical protein